MLEVKTTLYRFKLVGNHSLPRWPQSHYPYMGGQGQYAAHTHGEATCTPSQGLVEANNLGVAGQGSHHTQSKRWCRGFSLVCKTTVTTLTRRPLCLKHAYVQCLGTGQNLNTATRGAARQPFRISPHRGSLYTICSAHKQVINSGMYINKSSYRPSKPKLLNFQTSGTPCHGTSLDHTSSNQQQQQPHPQGNTTSSLKVIGKPFHVRLQLQHTTML